MLGVAEGAELVLAWLLLVVCLPLFVVAFAARVATHWTVAGWDAADRAL
jgi:hypothetical protein